MNDTTKRLVGSKFLRFAAHRGMLAVIPLALGTVSSTSIAESSIVAIPLLPTGGYSYPSALTSDGSLVVGMATVGSAGNWRGFRWIPGGEMTVLAPSGGLANSRALDVSDDGKVVGVSWPTFWSEAPTTWSTTDAVLPMSLPTNGYWGTAAAISSNGEVTVGSAGSPGYQTAVRWTQPSSPSAFLTGFEARATNRDGSVIVGTHVASTRAMLWSKTTGAVELGILPGTTASSALHISADGNTVVGYSFTAGSSYRSFRWTAAEGMISLGDLEGSTKNVAVATSNDGLLIVGYTIEGDAYIWRPTTGMRKLLDSLKAAGGDTSGWTRLTQPTEVSADGRFVIGYGEYNGSTRGFYADLGGCSTIQSIRSGELGPISSDAIRHYTFANLSPATGEGSLSIQARGDLALETQFLTLKVDGQFLATVFVNNADSCSGTTQSATVTIPEALLTTLLSDGSVHVSVEASSEVGSCNQGSCALSFNYQPVTADCDGNGVPDPCDIRLGAGDCDIDGILDACEIAAGFVTDFDQNGVPDSCQCLADLFVDGVVNGADLGISLSQWGLGAGAASDINRDGTVNGADLSIILSSWGACP